MEKAKLAKTKRSTLLHIIIVTSREKGIGPRQVEAQAKADIVTKTKVKTIIRGRLHKRKDTETEERPDESRNNVHSQFQYTKQKQN